MNLRKPILSLVGAALLFSFSALAADLNKGKLHLLEKTDVEGKWLAPGRYTVEWDGAGPTVQVTILHDKQTVVTFSARITQEPSRNIQNAYSFDAAPDGSHFLTAIYLSGKSFSIDLDQKSAAQQSPTPDSK